MREGGAAKKTSPRQLCYSVPVSWLLTRRSAEILLLLSSAYLVVVRWGSSQARVDDDEHPAGWLSVSTCEAEQGFKRQGFELVMPALLLLMLLILLCSVCASSLIVFSPFFPGGRLVLVGYRLDAWEGFLACPGREHLFGWRGVWPSSN